KRPALSWIKRPPNADHRRLRISAEISQVVVPKRIGLRGVEEPRAATLATPLRKKRLLYNHDFPRNTEDMAFIELLIHDRAGCGSDTTAAVTGKSRNNLRIGATDDRTQNSGKALGPNRITGYVDRLQDINRPPVAYAHPHMAAKV